MLYKYGKRLHNVLGRIDFSVIITLKRADKNYDLSLQT